MSARGRLFVHASILVAGAVVLIAAHGIVLRYLSGHAALPAAAVAGVVILVVVKHLGLIGVLSAKFWRHLWRRRG